MCRFSLSIPLFYSRSLWEWISGLDEGVVEWLCMLRHPSYDERLRAFVF